MTLRLALASTLLVSALGLAGCGADNQTTPAPATSTTETPALKGQFILCTDFGGDNSIKDYVRDITIDPELNSISFVSVTHPEEETTVLDRRLCGFSNNELEVPSYYLNGNRGYNELQNRY